MSGATLMFCQKCGAPLPEGSAKCLRCRPSVVGPVAPGPAVSGAGGGAGNDPFMQYIVPTMTSGWAIAAGYAGLFAITVFLAPLALIFGLLALRDLRRHPEKHGWGRMIFGLTLGSLFTMLLLFFVCLFAVVAITGAK